jgi:hypothetical protein
MVLCSPAATKAWGDMQQYDDGVIQTAAAAFQEAWQILGGGCEAHGLSPEATSLALGIGIVYSASRGQRRRAAMRRSALDQVAATIVQRQQGYPRFQAPVHLRDPDGYYAYAEEIRAMAAHVRDRVCQHQLLTCARDFERIAASRSLLSASVARLYPRH